jgi:glutathione S-transferase
MEKSMKLYVSPNFCSLSPHIALREVGLPFDLEPVDLAKKTLRTGADFKVVNAKGSVPALELDDGQVLTEGAAIVQYIADRKPETGLLPPAGTLERYRVQEWLNYVSTELHKFFGPLFDPRASEEARQATRDVLSARFDYVSKKLEGRTYLVGDTYSIADGHLFTILRWAKVFPFMKLDLSAWPVLEAYLARIAERPAVQAALQAEAALH